MKCSGIDQLWVCVIESAQFATEVSVSLSALAFVKMLFANSAVVLEMRELAISAVSSCPVLPQAGAPVGRESIKRGSNRMVGNSVGSFVRKVF